METIARVTEDESFTTESPPWETERDDQLFYQPPSGSAARDEHAARCSSCPCVACGVMRDASDAGEEYIALPITGAAVRERPDGTVPCMCCRTVAPPATSWRIYTFASGRYHLDPLCAKCDEAVADKVRVTVASRRR